MATALPVETSRPDGFTEQHEPAVCECDRGVQYEHRCCGKLTQGGRCCMEPEWVMRECDQCGGVGIR
jgi:hypothetical protein